MSLNYLLYQVNIMLRRVKLKHNIRSGMPDTVEIEAMKHEINYVNLVNMHAIRT